MMHRTDLISIFFVFHQLVQDWSSLYLWVTLSLSGYLWPWHQSVLWICHVFSIRTNKSSRPAQHDNVDGSKLDLNHTGYLCSAGSSFLDSLTLTFFIAWESVQCVSCHLSLMLSSSFNPPQKKKNKNQTWMNPLPASITIFIPHFTGICTLIPRPDRALLLLLRHTMRGLGRHRGGVKGVKGLWSPMSLNEMCILKGWTGRDCGESGPDRNRMVVDGGRG